MITTSTISFIYWCILEQKYDGKIKVPAGARNFPRFLRGKTGIAEAHVHMMFHEEVYPEKSHLEIFLPIIPDLIDFINYVNDIFSFYKESVIGPERLNFICNLAQAQSKSPLDALRSTCANVVQNVHNVRKVLSRHPQMLNTTEQFLCGYIFLYLFQDRYRLSEMELLDADGKQIRRAGLRHEAQIREESLEQEVLVCGVEGAYVMFIPRKRTP